MTAVRTGDRIVASVIAADSGDWQVVSTPVGFNGFTAPDFAENDLVHGFLIHEDGEQWEVYDFKGADATHLLEILSLSGTVTLGRPAVPSRSSNSDGSRIAAGSGTHTLVVEVGADSVERTMRETSPFVKTFTAADATPSIADHRFFKTNGTTAITRLDDKIDGQRVLIFRGDADITFHHNGTDLDLVGGADFTLTAATPAIEFIVVAGVAKQISGTRLASAVTAGDTTSAVTPDAVKTYVDQVAAGLNPKAAAKVATTATITLSGAQTIDGVAVVANDRVLVKNQSTASQNGLYDVKAGSWSRSGDMDAWVEVPSAYVWVAQGAANADTGWVCTSDVGGTIGSTAITWVQFGGANYVSPAVQAALDLKAPLDYTPTWAGAITRTVNDKLRDLPHLYDLVNQSARASVTDWAPYLEAANATGEDFVLPSERLPLLSIATLDAPGGGLIGQGRDTVLVCANPTTTADILRIGDGTNECAGVELQNLTIWASVARTGGYAINARKAAYAAHRSLRIGSLEEYTAAGNAHKLYNGVYHDRFAQIVYDDGGEAVVSNEGFSLRGNSDQSFGVEILWDGNFRIVKATTAIRIGGACGGIYLGRMDVSECVDAILVDRTLTNAFNREIFSSHQTTLDTCSGYAVGVMADSLALWRGGFWSVNNGSASKPAVYFADSATVSCQVEMVGGIIRRSYKDGMYQKTGSLTFVGEVEQSGFRGGTPGGPGHGLVTGGSLGWLSFNGTLYANGDATRGYGIHIETGLSLARIDVTGIDLANGQGGVEHDDYPGKEIRNAVLSRANYWTGKQNFVGGIINSGNIEGPATTTANTIGANPNASITDGGYIQVYGSTHSGAPKRAVLGAGNSGVAVTVDPTTGVTIAGDVTSAISLKQDPATGTYMLDGSGNTKTIANGANAALADGSGLIIAVNPGNGDVGVYIVGGGSAKLISSSVGTWVAPTTTPGGGTQSIQWDSVNKYRLYNNFGSSQAFVVSLLFKARAGN